VGLPRTSPSRSTSTLACWALDVSVWVPIDQRSGDAQPSGGTAGPADWSTSSVLLLDRHSGRSLAMAAEGLELTGWMPGAPRWCLGLQLPLVPFSHCFAACRVKLGDACGAARSGKWPRQARREGQAPVNPWAMGRVLKPIAALLQPSGGAV